MKHIFIIFLAFPLLVSCPAEVIDMINSYSDRINSTPVLLDYDVISNSNAVFHFDNPVFFTDIRLNGKENYKNGAWKKMQSIKFDTPLSSSENTLSFSVINREGNSSRYTMKISSVNEDQASLLITEASIKGTKDSPDRIELICMESGSTDGIVIADAEKDSADHLFFLPHMKLEKGDILIVYWDSDSDYPSAFKRGDSMTYKLSAESEETLISTNGAIVLYSSINGKGDVMDALLYNKSDAEDSEGFGNIKSQNTYAEMEKLGQWSGATVLSDEVTASRVIARYYPYEDTDTCDDFYITKPRHSTFGYVNTNEAYK